MRFGLYFDPVRSDDTPEVVEDPLCDLRFIHGIDMDMAASVRNQVDDLMGSVYDPGLLHGFRRVSEAVYKSGELGRNNASRELDGALHLPAAGDRHDAGEDRDSDPGFPEAIQVIVVDRVVEEASGCFSG